MCTKAGVRFHLGRTVSAFDGKILTLDDGRALDVDLVVLGIGVRPRLDLAEAAGLKLDRGVAVDARFRTSAPGVFAAGDIARYANPAGGAAIRVEHWVTAERQGQIAAANMLGMDTPIEEPAFFWSAHYDVSIRYVGHAEQWDRSDVDGDLDLRRTPRCATSAATSCWPRRHRWPYERLEALRIGQSLRRGFQAEPAKFRRPPLRPGVVVLGLALTADLVAAGRRTIGWKLTPAGTGHRLVVSPPARYFESVQLSLRPYGELGSVEAIARTD